MRKLIAIYLLAYFILWGSVIAEGGEWILLERTNKAVYYYATDRQRPPGGNLITVWVRKVYLESGKRDHAVGQFEIDCARRIYSKLQTKVFSKNGSIMQSSGLNPNTIQLRISPGTPMDKVYQILCSARF